MKHKAIFISLISILLTAVTVTALVVFIKPANGKKYDVSSVTRDESSPLKDKTLYWLGSSVTLGMKSNNQAVSDFLSAKTGCKSVKEAVSGTTLIDEPVKEWFTTKDSYVSRLVNGSNFDKSEKVDFFICQISTNDAKKENASKLGSITNNDVTNKEDFNVKTTIGATEYVIAYVWETWHCPIYFYSGSEFGSNGKKVNNPTSENYQNLISETKKVVAKWSKIVETIKVIDLFNDVEFNNISYSTYKFYMADPIHPYKAGYKNWLTPYFESFFTKELS